MKYKIENNTVQETLIIPLYARKICSELYPNLYRDETAVRLIDEIDYDFSEAEKNSRGLMHNVQGEPVYELTYKGKGVIKPSKLGLELKNDPGLMNGFACPDHLLQTEDWSVPDCR